MLNSAVEMILIPQVGEVGHTVGGDTLGDSAAARAAGREERLCRGWCGAGRLGWQEGLVTRGGSDGGCCRGGWEEEDLPQAGEDLVGGATDGPGSRSEELGSW